MESTKYDILKHKLAWVTLSWNKDEFNLHLIRKHFWEANQITLLGGMIDVHW